MEKIFSTKGKFAFAAISFAFLLSQFWLNVVGFIMIPILSYFIIALFNLLMYAVYKTFAAERWAWFSVFAISGTALLCYAAYLVVMLYPRSEEEYITPEGMAFMKFFFWYIWINCMFAVMCLSHKLFAHALMQKNELLFQH